MDNCFELGVNLTLCTMLLLAVIIIAYQLLSHRKRGVELDALRAERDYWLAQAPLDPAWTLGEPRLWSAYDIRRD